MFGVSLNGDARDRSRWRYLRAAEEYGAWVPYRRANAPASEVLGSLRCDNSDMSAQARLAGGPRLAWLTPRRHARRAEAFIQTWQVPDHIWRTVAKRYPELDYPWGQEEVERGLCEWLISCAWRGKRALGMPSRLVDEAWHALILDSLAYMELCRQAFGEYLHHFPEGASKGDAGPALVNTVWAWDRSEASHSGEATMWSLDERYGIDDPWGLDETQLIGVRARTYDGGNAACGTIMGVGGDTPPQSPAGGGCGGGSGGFSGSGGGDGGGGGCGGGGGGGS